MLRGTRKGAERPTVVLKSQDDSRGGYPSRLSSRNLHNLRRNTGDLKIHKRHIQNSANDTATHSSH